MKLLRAEPDVLNDAPTMELERYAATVVLEEVKSFWEQAKNQDS